MAQARGPRPTQTLSPAYYCVDSCDTLGVLPAVRPAAHDRYVPGLLAGTLTVTLKTEQLLLVGSGAAEVGDNDRQVLRFARIQTSDSLVIPGSTLRGVIRSYVEALTLSCLNGGCGTGDPCPACAMFGRADRQGRVSFDDAVFPAGTRTKVKLIAQRYAPQQSCPGRKFYLLKSPDAQNPDTEQVEVIDKGANVGVTCRFANLHQWELGALLLAMGLGDGELRFSLKMGGAKNRSMGRVSFRDAKLAAEDRTVSLRARIADEQSMTAAVVPSDCIEKYLTLLGDRREQVLGMVRLLRGRDDEQTGAA